MRVLAIANGCFSQTDANGRTLAKMFTEFDPDDLAQFFVYGTPDTDVCHHYYQVTDREALRSFLKQHSYGSVPKAAAAKGSVSKATIKHTKTPLTMLLRELVWKQGKWNSTALAQWIKDFKPACIFLFLADNAFLISLAVEIAKRYGIGIVAYSSEEYYFKDYNYLTKRPSIMYWLFSRNLRKAYRTASAHIHSGIFNTPMLTEAYAREFSYPCECIMPVSDIDYIENWRLPNRAEIRISYLGNLGLNRHKALMKIAEALQHVLPGQRVRVYGKMSESIRDEFVGHPFIEYEGFVDYDEVIRIMHSSTLLLHAEYNDDFHNRDLKYAFSTKIADSICCGTPLLLYAHPGLAETNFLAEEQCAFIAAEEDQLVDVLSTALTSEDARRTVVFKAKEIAERNFRRNMRFSDILQRACDENATMSNK